MGSESGNPSDWLPPGWKVRVKVRSSGRRDKCYINLALGLKFYSKPDVFRYLENSQKDNKSNKPDEIDNKMQNLPPGWVKEVRTLEKRGRVKSDTYYIDPVTGSQFRSMEEVSRYLKSMDSGKREPKQASTVGKTEQSADKIAGKDQSLKLDAGSKVAELEDRGNDTRSGKLLIKPAEGSDKELQNGGRRHSKRLAEIKLKEIASEDQSLLQSGLEYAEEEKHVDMRETEGSEQREKKSNSMGNTKKTNSKRKCASDLPRRTSKRLARVEAGSLLEVKASEASKAESSNEPEIDSEAKFSRFDTPKELKSVGISSSKEENGIEKQQFDSVLNALLSDPCFEFAIKTLTGAIPMEEIIRVNNSCSSPRSSSLNQTSAASSSSSMLPLVNSNDWAADPCYDFAVKTLNSNVCTERNDASFITFQQPLSSSKLPKNNLCLSNCSFTTQSNACVRKAGEQKGGLI